MKELIYLPIMILFAFTAYAVVRYAIEVVLLRKEAKLIRTFKQLIRENLKQ